MWFDSWFALGRVVVVGALAYAVLILILRISGKRTLAKMNAFDLVVTVALGSSLASVLLSGDIALAEGIVAFCVLVGLQYMLARAAVRSGVARRLMKSTPRILLSEGRFDPAALRRERVTRAEILAAVRGAGAGDVGDVAAVILETDGSFSVILRSRLGNGSALSTVAGPEPSAVDFASRTAGGR